MDWRGGTFHFNPLSLVDLEDTILLLGSWPEQLAGVLKHLDDKTFPQVIAPETLYFWLIEKGWPSEKISTGWEQDGLSIVLEEYKPIPLITPKEAIYKAASTIKNPLGPLRRLREVLLNPVSTPQIAWITFPSGKKLVHLNCSIHQRQESAWVSNILDRVGETTWTIVGADYEEYTFCGEVIPKFTCDHILLTDLVGDYRRKAGLPTNLLTPLADKIISSERVIHLFPTQVTHRFDHVQLQ